jgi:hypothetical protein
MEESMETAYIDTSWTERVIKTNAEWKKNPYSQSILYYP